MKLTADLSTGSVAVEIDSSVFPPQELFGFAERRNPKRSFLFVSQVLGRYVPVRPGLMRDTYRHLVARFPAPLPGPVLVIGMAETAIGLGAGVHSELPQGDTLYLPTTRHPLGTPLLARFSEEHSHATHQLLHMPKSPRHQQIVREAQTLVLVDDEATTGRTLHNLARALARAGLAPKRVICAALTDWSDGRVDAAVSEVFPQAEVICIALATGRYSWTPGSDPARPQLPMPDIAERGSYDLCAEGDWGRLGLQDSVRMLRADAHPGRRTLVIGTSEFVWQPFLLAEELEQSGEHVKFAAVGRSPVFKGLAIKQLVRCHDKYGLGLPNYL